jgi:HSP20 family protein
MSQVLPDRRPATAHDPVVEVDPVAERLRRMVEQTFAGFVPPTLLSEAATWSPLVDIEEEDNTYVLDIDLPGVKPDDINVELVGNELTINGEIKERERKGIVRRRTRRVGRFSYRVMLPSEVDADKIEARFDHGVLNLRIPKAEKARRKRIELKKS